MHRTILITGGAGYIGSHIVWWLKQQGYTIIILDNLIYHQDAPFKDTIFIQDDFASVSTLEHIFNHYHIDAVIHCAALIEVHTSLQNPQKYYENNFIKTVTLLDTMLTHGIRNIIFSSSCAVYGAPQEIPMDEYHPRNPITPYGTTKYMVELLLADYARAYDLRFVSLRYFNAAGAEPDYGLGEQHEPETHIIPLLLHAMHYQKPFTLFGNDYETADGSCIRDFLHVTDIAHAHFLALQHLEKGRPSDYFNLATGHGISMKQLIKTAEHLFNTIIKVVVADRRPGDPARLVADPSKAMHILNWKATHSHIEHILRSAYAYFMLQQRKQNLAHNNIAI